MAAKGWRGGVGTLGDDGTKFWHVEKGDRTMWIMRFADGETICGVRNNNVSWTRSGPLPLPDALWDNMPTLDQMLALSLGASKYLPRSTAAARPRGPRKPPPGRRRAKPR